jgi:uncharacterized membrane protein HdeD (DUF308 family)
VYDLPSYVWALVLAGVVGIPAFTCAVLYRGAVAATTAAVLGGWLVVSGLLARAGVYRQDPEMPCPGSAWWAPAP